MTIDSNTYAKSIEIYKKLVYNFMTKKYKLHEV